MYKKERPLNSQTDLNALKKEIRILKPQKSVLKELKRKKKDNVELIIEIGHNTSGHLNTEFLYTHSQVIV